MSEFGKLRRFFAGPRALVLLAPFILLAPVWAAGKALYWGTPSTQFVPWWWWAWQTLQAGESPLWNPQLGMGAPLLANYQTGLLYPPNWLYFLLARLGGLPLLAWGQALLVAAHLAWAGLGMLLLVRRLGQGQLAQTVGGLAFGLSGYLVARAHFLSINAAVAWLPWLLLAGYELVQRPRRRAMLKLALLLALQWLAGHAQIAWYSLLLLVAWMAFWAWQAPVRDTWWYAMSRLIGAGVLAFALSAIQLLPTAEYLQQSSRAAQVDRILALTYSFWPWRLLGLLSPNFFGNPATGEYWGYGNFWEDAAYIGLLPFGLGLAWLWRNRTRVFARFFAILIFISFLLALGFNTPIFPFLYSSIPTFDLFQAPTRFTIWAVFALALLGALGVERWRRPRGRALYWSRLAVAGSVAILFAALVFRDLSSLEIPDSLLAASAALGLVAVAATSLNLLAPKDDKPSPRWAWAVSLLVAADLLWAGWGLNPGVDLAFYKEAAFSPVELQDSLGEGRLFLSPKDEDRLKFERFFRFDTFAMHEPPAEIRAALLPNTTLLDGIPSANNFDPLLSARYTAWLDAYQSAAPEMQESMLARMAVTVLEEVHPASLEVSFTEIESLPRVRWVPCARAVADSETALDLVTLGESDPMQEIAVEMPAAAPDEACDAGLGEPANLEWLERSANRIRIAVEAPAAGWLVLADSYYPGWRALLDGHEVPIYAADGLFRAVDLPVGTYVIEMVYRPCSFTAGAAISALGLLALTLLWRSIGENEE